METKQTAALYAQPPGFTAAFVLLLATFFNKICLD
jgi:hypothetical protein